MTEVAKIVYKNKCVATINKAGRDRFSIRMCKEVSGKSAIGYALKGFNACCALIHTLTPAEVKTFFHVGYGMEVDIIRD